MKKTHGGGHPFARTGNNACVVVRASRDVAVPQEGQGTMETVWECGLHCDIARQHRSGQQRRGYNKAFSDHFVWREVLKKTEWSEGTATSYNAISTDGGALGNTIS